MINTEIPKMTATLPDGRALEWHDSPPYLTGDDELVERLKEELAKEDWITVTPTGPTVRSTRRNKLAVFATANMLLGPRAHWKGAPDVTFGVEEGAADGPDEGWRDRPDWAQPTSLAPMVPGPDATQSASEILANLKTLAAQGNRKIQATLADFETPGYRGPQGALERAVDDARMVIGLAPRPRASVINASGAVEGDHWEEQWRDPEGENGGQWIEMPDIKATIDSGSSSTGEQKATTTPTEEPAPPTMVRENYVLEKLAADVDAVLSDQQAKAEAEGDQDRAKLISDSREKIMGWDYDTLRLDSNFDRLGTTREELETFLAKMVFLPDELGLGPAIVAMRDALSDADERNFVDESEEPEGYFGPPEDKWKRDLEEAWKDLPEAADIGWVEPTLDHAPDYVQYQRGLIADMEAVIEALNAMGWENYRDLPEELFKAWGNSPLSRSIYLNDPEGMRRAADEELASLKGIMERDYNMWLKNHPNPTGRTGDFIGRDMVPGPVLMDQLAQVQKGAAILNAELERRIAARATDGLKKDDLRVKERLVQLAQTSLEKKQEEQEQRILQVRQEGFESYMQNTHDPDVTFKTIEEVYAAAAAKRITGKSKAAKRAVEEIERKVATSPELSSKEYGLREAERNLVKQQAGLEQARTGQLVPGTREYAQAQREESLAMLSELRDMGGGQRFDVSAIYDETKREQAMEALNRAGDAFPTRWHDELRGRLFRPTGDPEADKYDEGAYKVDIIDRGHHDWKARELMLSHGVAQLDGQNQFDRVAMHELGHGMEDVVDGLTFMERAMVFFRSPAGQEVLRDLYGNGKEKGYFDQWSIPYSGKIYSYSMSQELFTTGIESLMAGSGYFLRSEDMGGFDHEFRGFILAMLARL